MSAFIAVFLSSFISSRVLSLSLVFLHVLHLRRLVRSRGHLRLFPRQRRHEQVPHFSRVCRSFSPRKSRGRIPICAFRSQNAGLVTEIYNCANVEVIHLTYEKFFKSMTPSATFHHSSTMFIFSPKVSHFIAPATLKDKRPIPSLQN